MRSLYWFLAIVAAIVGVVLAAILGRGLLVFMIEGGGCAMLVGLGLIVAGGSMAAGGGAAGGFGILLALVGVLLIFTGISMFRGKA